MRSQIKFLFSIIVIGTIVAGPDYLFLSTWVQETKQERDEKKGNKVKEHDFRIRIKESVQ